MTDLPDTWRRGRRQACTNIVLLHDVKLLWVEVGAMAVAVQH